ncbi:RING-type E3 ubiquitin transferase [Psidium guajava]|nr:RING-type E3 ubiquitin transferase [Psidium guajava]
MGNRPTKECYKAARALVSAGNYLILSEQGSEDSRTAAEPPSLRRRFGLLVALRRLWLSRPAMKTARGQSLSPIYWIGQ